MKNILEQIKFVVAPGLVVVPKKKLMPRFSMRILGRVVNFGHKYVTDWNVSFRAFGAPNKACTGQEPSSESESKGTGGSCQ
jgi:hypothetical protein